MLRKLLLGAATIALLATGTAVATSTVATASTSNNTNIWAPCSSSEQGPPYVVIVKGIYNACVHYDAQVFQFDSVTGNKAMLIEITNEGDGVWGDLV
jgi:hypothetical protein